MNRRLKDSYVYDPEEVGYFIRDNVPKELRLNDFQDFPMWRQFNYQMLEYLNNNHNDIIIVTMTITNEIYYNEIIERLQQQNVKIKHFTLMASKETLLKRLRKRGDGRNSWAARQIDRCLNALSSPVFKEHINTDKMTIYEVVDHIAELCKLDLLPDNRNFIEKKVYKLRIWFKHIRLF